MFQGGYRQRYGSELPQELCRALEADEFSGFVMFKFGRMLDEAQAAMRRTKEPSTHPKNERRLAAIKKGYEGANSQGHGEPSYEA